MRKAILILAFALGGLYASAQNIEFAEISFYQDSVNPMTIHLVCKAKCNMYTTFAQDEEIVIWGDGTQSGISLSDTTFQYPGMIPSDPLKTYEAMHTYSPTYADSTVLIGFYMQDGVFEYLANSFNDPEGLTLCPVATINFAYLSSHQGLSPPHFPSYYNFLTGDLNQTFSYNPWLIYDSLYTLRVDMINPVWGYPDFSAGGIYVVYAFPWQPTNITIFDSTNGSLVWNHPCFTGGFMISYVASIYKNGVFVCSMTRDFMVDVDSASGSTGINPLAISNPSIRLHPNPNTGAFTLETTGAISAGYTITDMLGRQIASAVITSDSQAINVPLAPGVYQISVRYASGAVGALRFEVVK